MSVQHRIQCPRCSRIWNLRFKRGASYTLTIPEHKRWRDLDDRQRGAVPCLVCTSWGCDRVAVCEVRDDDCPEFGPVCEECARRLAHLPGFERRSL